MIFSLQRRFFLFLLCPVVLILLATGFASFLYARSYLLDEWKSSALLRLGKTAHQIQMRLDEKRNMLKLIAASHNIPDGAVAQTFLMQQLMAQNGVFFVDVEPIGKQDKASNLDKSRVTEPFQQEHVGQSPRPAPRAPMRGMHMQGRHHMRGSMGHMGRGDPRAMESPRMMMRHGIRPVWLDPKDSVSFLLMGQDLPGKDGIPSERLTARVSFDSFLEEVLAIGRWTKSYACLVMSDGTFLAHTAPNMKGRTKLADTDDPLEKRTLEEMKTKNSGTVFGKGHPPDEVIGFYKVPSTDWYLVLSSKGSTILEPMVRFRFNYMLAGIIAVIIIALLIRFNTQPVARSIARIAQAAAAVEKGDYSVTLPEDRSDEIGQLKRRFSQMVNGLKQRDFIERTLGRYVDKTVAEELLGKPDALNLGGETKVVTIMMADLRGFTKMSEKLEPQQVINIINRHFSGMIAVIERYRGIIVDFYGDSVLVFFNGIGADIAERALDAVKCGLDMQREVLKKAGQYQQDGLPTPKMGIGIHTGEVVVGNIGSEKRAKYGIVGSNVNETDRIQSFAHAGTVMISEQTFHMVDRRVSVGEQCEACLKGLEGPRNLYEVLEVRDQSIIQKKQIDSGS
ncbi:adenylate/guanylate cyclase domain-containing protein [Thermodesulfobacteriota bacterium]